MNESKIRPLALGVIRKGDKFLVTEFYNRSTGQLLYRPAGGGIEFGELGEQAVVREYQEELTAEIENVRFLGMLENLFNFEDVPGHEIVLVYEATFADQTLYDRDVLEGSEMDGSPIKALWKSLIEIEKGEGKLVPEALSTLLRTTYTL